MCPIPSPRRLSRLLPALLLTGCGGGFLLTVNDTSDQTPPSVNLVTAVTTVTAGGTVQFVAAASDENGVDQVELLRVDSSGTRSVSLGTDTQAPYEFSVQAPTDGRATFVVFARARDSEGNTADSPTITLTIGP